MMTETQQPALSQTQTSTPFLSIFLKTVIYLALVFIIVFSFIFSKIELSKYLFKIPPPPIMEEAAIQELTITEKQNMLETLNDDSSRVSADVMAEQLVSIPKHTSNLTDEEKNKILQGF